MFDIGGPEFLMILVGALILFGPKKLPELAQTLGKGLRQFRRAQQEFNEQITTAIKVEEQEKNEKWSRPIDPNTVSRETPEIDLGTNATDQEPVENDIAAGIPSEALDGEVKSESESTSEDLADKPEKSEESKKNTS